jgi:hypothetical protein
MGSALQTRIGEAVLEIPPMPGDQLVAWVLMAEWREEDGQTKLTRLLAGDSSAWQAKGYLYEGLNGKWPLPNSEHHNPGHPSGWMRVDD